MMDLQVRYEKLLADTAECAKLRDLAADPAEREFFGRLAEHLITLASLMQRAVGLPSPAELRQQRPGPTTEPSSAKVAV